MGRFKVAPFDKGYGDGNRFDGLYDPRYDYQPDERAEYRQGFDAGRNVKLAGLCGGAR